MNIPHYLLLSSRAGHHFNLKENEETGLGTSEVYKNKSGAKNGIISLQENSQLAKQYDQRESKDKRYYFVIKGGNGEIIFTSNLCDTKRERSLLIRKVKSYAVTTQIVNG